MSTQPETLDRSVLERKARDELQQIAGAIGASVNSRAKKADIVDAILAAAGGTSAQPSEETSSPSDNGSSRPRTRVRSAGNLFDVDDLDVAVDSSPAVPEPEVKVPDVETPDEEPKAEWELAMEADQPDRAGSDGQANGTKQASVPAGGRSEDSPNEDGPKRRVRTVGKSDDAAAPEAKESAGDKRPDSSAASKAESNQQGKAESNQQGKAESNQSGSNRSGGGQQADKQSGDSGSGKSGSANSNNSGAESGNDAANSDGGNGDDQGDSNNKRRRRRRGREREPREEQFTGDPVEVEGIVDLRDEGYGFLRTKGFLPSKEDCYLPAKLVRQHGLRKGDTITGTSRPANRSEKNPALLRVDTVNGVDPEEAKKRPRFENLTPLFPDQKLRLELTSDPSNMTARIIDLVSPIGKGQRGLIVSPP
ncbi:MAG: hypothetical protein KDB16_10280, partial [Acidimicrobiales bacterium]|nr:hypothetical protein [Acidimicrobiales bacterium]